MVDETSRYAAKLLFQFRIEFDGESGTMRLCEERILLLHAKRAKQALSLAKKRGKAAQHRFRNDAGGMVNFEFVGVLDLLRLGSECEEDEVWYDITRRKLPMERSATILPAERELNAFREEEMLGLASATASRGSRSRRR
ncbi:DUF4288 domain-containing protein [Arenimonas sp.]|uniref:DUF4288 domain-containing protein n=1 Tax=Arenimonas sp. TaxID=1872635 RepID=UPI0039E2C73A